MYPKLYCCQYPARVQVFLQKQDRDILYMYFSNQQNRHGICSPHEDVEAIGSQSSLSEQFITTSEVLQYGYYKEVG